jgi:threonine synthase
MANFVTHLESAIDQTRFSPDEPRTTHQNRPLWVRYDLPAIARACNPADIARRPPTLWRYRELLPVADDHDIITLGEGFSPLLPVPKLADALGFYDLTIKDESQLPTGSFKARGLSVAVSMARRFGFNRFAIPTAGNAGGALAAYGARAGAEVYVFMPDDTPVTNQFECALAGAHTYRVNGLINDCAKIVRDGKDQCGWFDFSTLKEPYRIEGKKTMGLELAEQLDWQLPDAILYPTGGGTGLIGMWKAFNELRELGWLRSDKLPRMVAVQSDTCAPIVKAFDSNARFADPWPNASTCAPGIRVPVAIGDFMILDAIAQSGGCAIAVPDRDIPAATARATALEGISICPEAAACVLAAEKLLETGWLKPDEHVVIFNTGSASKYTEIQPPNLPRIDITKPIDYATLVHDATMNNHSS